MKAFKLKYQYDDGYSVENRDAIIPILPDDVFDINGNSIVLGNWDDKRLNRLLHSIHTRNDDSVEIISKEIIDLPIIISSRILTII